MTKETKSPSSDEVEAAFGTLDGYVTECELSAMADAVETLRAHIAALEAELEQRRKGSQPQPIETAPKDGSPILVCGGIEHGSMGSGDTPLTRPCVAEWYDDGESSTWFKSDDCYSTAVSPTHWTHLPTFNGKAGEG